MNKTEIAAAIAVLVIGVSLLVAALQFPFLSQCAPGPGFLPVLIALGILATSLALVAGALRGTTVVSAPRWPPLSGWWRVALMLLAMTVSFLLLEILGFLIVTTLFMAVMIYCLGERSWRMLATVPPLSAIALYAIFAVWLRVPLPKGVFALFT